MFSVFVFLRGGCGIFSVSNRIVKEKKQTNLKESDFRKVLFPAEKGVLNMNEGPQDFQDVCLRTTSEKSHSWIFLSNFVFLVPTYF